MAISIAEIARHNTADDLWLVVDGAVYDLSAFVARHPGGADVLLRYAGRDASRPYAAVHAPSLIRASPDARLLGAVDEATVTPQWRSAAISAGDDEGAGGHEDARPPLDAILNLHDFADAAHAALPPQAWAYLSAGAGDCLTRDANAAVLRQLWLRPAVCRNVATPTTATCLLGIPLRMPVYMAPTGASRTAGPGGEPAMAAAAAQAGIVPIISTVASFPYADILAALPPGAPIFFQLYVDRERSRTAALLRTLLGSPAGRDHIRALVVTVDVPVVSKREADERERARAARARGAHVAPGGIAKQTGAFVDPAFVWADLAWLRTLVDDIRGPGAPDMAALPILLKGIQRADDAVKALACGVQGIILSNHGGRAADPAPPAILTLLELHRCCPQVFGRMAILVDGGFRRGGDVLMAICLGADAVGFGRPFVYSVGYGQAGVEHAAAIIHDELQTSMQLCGISDLMRDAHPDFVNTAAVDHLVPWPGSHPYAKKTSRL